MITWGLPRSSKICNLNSPLTCNTTYSPFLGLGTLRDYYSAHHSTYCIMINFQFFCINMIYCVNWSVLALFASFHIITLTFPLLWISSIFSSAPCLFQVRIFAHAISFACVTLPFWIPTAPLPQTTLMYPLAISVNDSPSKTVSLILWLPKQERRFPLHP